MTISQQDLAARLRAAYRDGVVPPLRDGLSPTDADGAYAVQALNTAFWLAEGRKIIGRKVGLTAKAVQVQLGVDQPDFGVLFDDMVVPQGGELPAASVIQPKVEAEIAITFKHDLTDPQTTREMLTEAVDRVWPAIEIVDSRIADWKITFADTVADNGSSSHFVLGGDGAPLGDLDLWSCGMVLEVNGEVASLGAGAACLGHPLIAATWLARTLAERGDPLRAGDIVLTGALGPMVAIQPGDVVKATIGGLGDAQLRFGALR